MPAEEVRTVGDDVFTTVFRVVAGLVAGVAALGGVLAIVHGLRRGATARELARTGTRTSGVVLANQMHSGTEGGTTFSPVVRFTDSSGRDQVVAGEDRSSTSWVTGTTVQVLYDPERPDRVAVGPPEVGRWGPSWSAWCSWPSRRPSWWASARPRAGPGTRPRSRGARRGRGRHQPLTPVVPSIASRRRSACPLCREYSAITCT